MSISDDHIKKLREIYIPPIGFQNTGAICYFNSLMQCLLSCPLFIKYMIDKHHPLFIEFCNDILNDKWNVLFTTKLLHSLQHFQPNQSSSEYFVMMVDSFSLEKIFECQYKITTVCKECSHTKQKIDTTYNILLNDSFSEFIQTGCDLSSVLCDGCKQKTTLSEHRKIRAVSNVIAISLNKYFLKKVIEYPTHLTLESFQYRLKGTVEHHGVLGGGHYICRVARGDAYYLIDDKNVNSITKEQFEKCLPETYMLFYEQL